MTEDQEKGKTTMDVVQRAMGSFGPWHVVIAVALSLVKFPVAWHQLSITFLAPPVNFTCTSPLSATNASMLKSCNVNVGNNTIEPCTHFKYDRSIFKETIITQWDLVCSREQLANLAQLCTMFGILIGNMVFSTMADRIGRKVPLMIAVVLQSATGLLSAFVPWYELFLVLKFVAALATGGTMLISFVIVMEIVGVKWRSTLSVLFHVPFILGHLLNPLISYLTKTWYGFQMAVSIPPIFLLSYYWVVPESPRWLLAVGRTEEAEAILLKAAEKNRVPREYVTAAIQHSQQNQEGKKNVKHNITHLFRTPNMRMKSICVIFNWFAAGCVFFGLAQYIGFLHGNIFVNVAASAAMELPGTLIVLVLISRVSRLKILIGGSIVCSMSLLLLIVVTDPIGQVCLASLSLAAMVIIFPTIYLYSTEVFPTVVRNIGVGTGSICARVGSMIAPFIATMNEIERWLPPLIFGLLILVSGILCLLLPETRNCVLPDTIEDCENFGKKKKTKTQS